MHMVLKRSQRPTGAPCDMVPRVCKNNLRECSIVGTAFA